MFIGAGLICLKIERPAHFFLFSTIESSYNTNDFSDVAAFNRANAVLWMASGILTLIFAALLFFFSFLPTALLTAAFLLLQTFTSYLVYRTLVKRHLKK